MEEKGDSTELAGAPEGRDGVDSPETRCGRDPRDRTEGVHAVAQYLQRTFHVARHQHVQSLRMGRRAIRPPEDVPQRHRSQLWPIARYQH